MSIPNPATTDWVPLWGANNVIPSVSARAYRTTVQSLGSGYVPASFNAVRFDPAGMWSASFPDRLTIQQDGTYVISGTVVFDDIAAAGGSTRLGAIQRVSAGSSYLLVETGNTGLAPIAGGATRCTPSTIAKLSAGDYIQLLCYQDSGSAKNTYNWGGAANQQNGLELSIALVGGPKGDVGVGVPSPVVSGQWIKGVGGSAVWSDIGSSDVRNGIQTMGGNQFRPNWSGQLEFWIDGTQVQALPYTIDTGWTNLVNYGYAAGIGDYGAPFGPCRIRKNSSNLVELQGLMVNNGGYSPGTAAFNIPAGCRPAAAGGRQHIFLTANSMGIGTETIRIIDGGYATISQLSVGSWISLCGISYYADA
jgi:hypothetical protein